MCCDASECVRTFRWRRVLAIHCIFTRVCDEASDDVQNRDDPDCRKSRGGRPDRSWHLSADRAHLVHCRVRVRPCLMLCALCVHLSARCCYHGAQAGATGVVTALHDVAPGGVLTLAVGAGASAHAPVCACAFACVCVCMCVSACACACACSCSCACSRAFACACPCASACAPAVGVMRAGLAELYSSTRAWYVCLQSGWGPEGNVYNVLRSLRGC